MTVMQPLDLLVAVSEICHDQSERHGKNKTEPNEFSGQIGNQFYCAESALDTEYAGMMSLLGFHTFCLSKQDFHGGKSLAARSSWHSISQRSFYSEVSSVTMYV